MFDFNIMDVATLVGTVLTGYILPQPTWATVVQQWLMRIVKEKLAKKVEDEVDSEK